MVSLWRTSKRPSESSDGKWVKCGVLCVLSLWKSGNNWGLLWRNWPELGNASWLKGGEKNIILSGKAGKQNLKEVTVL